MTLNADTLLDRLYLKGQITKWRIIAIIAMVAAAIIAIERGGKFSPLGNHIARLTIEGVILDDPAREQLIEELREDNTVKAVIVRLDTPGGSVVAGEELYTQLKELSKTKPVVAVMRTLAASAGYMTALGTDHIIAREGTITGSIGVILQTAEFTEMMQKLGITPISFKSSPLKGSPSAFEKVTPQVSAALQSTIRDFYRIFVDMVVERRKLSRERVLELADGRAYTGRQALDTKLIDEIGGEKEAVKWLVKNKRIDPKLEIEDARLKKDPENMLEKFSSMAGRAFFKNISLRLDGLTSIWQANPL